MYSLLYFDTEDFFSPPDSPIHRFPARLAEIMTRHDFPGCFHIHGEKVRFMERHGQTDVIEALKPHDVALHYDLGSIPPATGEAVSKLNWHEGVVETLRRETPGFQTLERVFGHCAGLTMHGGNWAPQIVYASGLVGKPFFGSPFRHPRRGVLWYANNLVISCGQSRIYFDPFYRDDAEFEERLAKVRPYLDRRCGEVDFASMFGCHPCRVLLDQFPDGFYFAHGQMPRAGARLPMSVPDVDEEKCLANFERLIVELKSHPQVEWTTMSGIAERYKRRPVRVSDQVLQHAAHKVVNRAGPVYTAQLSAAEILYLLARRHFAQSDAYDVPALLGPLEEPEPCDELPGGVNLDEVAAQVLQVTESTGHLPACIGSSRGQLSPAAALALLACDVVGRAPVSVRSWHLSVDAIPEVSEAAGIVRTYSKWACFSPDFDVEAIQRAFRLQCWTLKPALQSHEYAQGVEIGDWVNPLVPSTWSNPEACAALFEDSGNDATPRNS